MPSVAITLPFNQFYSWTYLHSGRTYVANFWAEAQALCEVSSDILQSVEPLGKIVAQVIKSAQQSTLLPSSELSGVPPPCVTERFLAVAAAFASCL